MPELKLSLQLYLVNPPKNRVFLASLPTSLPSQAELFFLLFSLWTSRAAGFQLVQGQAGMSSVLAFMYLACNPFVLLWIHLLFSS